MLLSEGAVLDSEAGENRTRYLIANPALRTKLYANNKPLFRSRNFILWSLQSMIDECAAGRSCRPGGTDTTSGVVFGRKKSRIWNPYEHAVVASSSSSSPPPILSHSLSSILSAPASHQPLMSLPTGEGIITVPYVAQRSNYRGSSGLRPLVLQPTLRILGKFDWRGLFRSFISRVIKYWFLILCINRFTD